MTSICSSLRLPRVAPVHAQGVVFEMVPADADAEPQASAAEDVDGRRLLGDEDGLPLREDDDAADESDALGGVREVAEEDEGLVEHAVEGVGGRPASEGLPIGAIGHVGADHVVVGEDVVEAHLLDGDGVGLDGLGVSGYLGLREDGADLQHGRASWGGVVRQGFYAGRQGALAASFPRGCSGGGGGRFVNRA